MRRPGTPTSVFATVGGWPWVSSRIHNRLVRRSFTSLDFRGRFIRTMIFNKHRANWLDLRHTRRMCSLNGDSVTLNSLERPDSLHSPVSSLRDRTLLMFLIPSCAGFRNTVSILFNTPPILRQSVQGIQLLHVIWRNYTSTSCKMR